MQSEIAHQRDEAARTQRRLPLPPNRVHGWRNVVGIAALLVASSLASPRTSYASFVVSPMEHHLTIGAGSRESAVLSIRNSGDRPLSLRLYLSDSVFDFDGGEQDIPLDRLDRSCAPWVHLASDLLDLAPGEMRQIDLDVAPAEDAVGSYWTKLYIEEVSVPQPMVEEHQGRRYEVFMRQRMGVRIFVDIEGTAVRDLIVTNVNVELRDEGNTEVVLIAENTGNSFLNCSGWFELRTSRGERVDTLRPEADGRFLVFPGGSRMVTAQVPPDLGPGTYTVLAVVDYGGENLIAGEQVLTVSPSQTRTTPVVASGAP
ncbi:MAG: hypothetical protein KDA27_02820 [Candidatus Eisenbacteria bacterium]|uniref:Uncharacterized protein n=1 Tax=Eiseniibacteriota bacterium TaxID=2212470 RepID=A0A956N9A6_UNCEI|nr:hypothetical protein [Candidatus Eisenbacteria bacterium]MCB9464910.1 hypothetical protein [Candidatus Eisenbacteria bacterium]